MYYSADMHPLAERAGATIRRHGLVPPGGAVLVALSGGPDSTALLHDWMGELAVSPDGSTILYGGGLSGRMRVRRRDQIGFTTIAGTEGSIAPFFSPDGTQIGFWMNGKLVDYAMYQRARRVLELAKLDS